MCHFNKGDQSQVGGTSKENYSDGRTYAGPATIECNLENSNSISNSKLQNQINISQPQLHSSSSKSNRPLIQPSIIV